MFKIFNDSELAATVRTVWLVGLYLARLAVEGEDLDDIQIEGPITISGRAFIDACKTMQLHAGAAAILEATIDPSRGETWQNEPGGYWTQRDDGRWLIVPYTSSGDYCGSLVEASNRKAWQEMYPEGEGVWWHERTEGFSSALIIVDLLSRRIPSEAAETVAALSEYPLISDDAHSQLEQEEQGEQWEDTGRDDFQRELEKHDERFETLFENMPESAITELYWKACESLDSWPYFEGTSCYFPTENHVAWVHEHLGLDFTEVLDPQELYNASPERELPWVACDYETRAKWEATARDYEN